MEEEEEKEEIEDIPRQVNRYGNDQMNRFGNQANRYNEPMNRYNPNDRYNQRFNDNMNRDVERLRNGQQPDVRRRPFGKAEEKEEAEEEEEEEEKAEMLLHINPYAATEIQIKEAFCFDLTVLVKGLPYFL